MLFHKERKDDEVFVGNANVKHNMSYLKNIKWRFGNQAYDIHNKKIPNDYMLPLFIKKEDYQEYDIIMNSRRR